MCFHRPGSRATAEDRKIEEKRYAFIVFIVIIYDAHKFYRAKANDRENAPLSFTAASCLFHARGVYTCIIYMWHACRSVCILQRINEWMCADSCSWTLAIKCEKLVHVRDAVVTQRDGRESPHSFINVTPLIATELYAIVKSDATTPTTRRRARQRAHHLLHALRYLQTTTCCARRWVFTYSLYSTRVFERRRIRNDRSKTVRDRSLNSTPRQRRCVGFAFTVIH